MIKKILIILIMTAIISFSLSGCSNNTEGEGFFDIPEGAKIQEVLNNMSDALLAGDAGKLALNFSDTCPGLKSELERFKTLIADTKLKTYEQTLKKSRRLKDGVVCSVEVHLEGTGKEKNISSRYMKDIYFIYENGAYKIEDYNYHPYMNPTVVAGSDSILSDAALSMSEALDSRLVPDKEHLQTYGDIIMVGSPYDNASILELEESGLTHIKVTDDYPGGSIGVVQVLTGVENYRHVLLIQGSSIKAAEDAVGYMTSYLKENPYMNPGIYFIEDERLKRAETLDLTTLTTLDAGKSAGRLREVQKHIESNLAVIQQELQAGREQLAREYRYIHSPFREDYPSAYGGFELNGTDSAKAGMAAVNSGFTAPALCTSAFRLPYGSTPGTLYAYARYVSEGGTEGTAAALRLLGFSGTEVFNAFSEGNISVFSNIGSGYAIAPSSVTPYTAEARLRAEEITILQNEGNYIDYIHSSSNISKNDILQITDRLNEVYSLGRKLSREKLSKADFKEEPLEKNIYLPYDAKDIYSLQRSTFISDDEPCTYSTLKEAKEELRLAMGELLSVKCTSFVVTTAARYPGSQFDYALYSSGLINVEHPNAYAIAAEKAKLVNKQSGRISNVLSDDASKIQKLLDTLSGISEIDSEYHSDRLIFPDTTLAGKSGSHRDKALLAFGLYSGLFGNTQDVYIAIGENNSYLVFASDGEWRYIDCKSNLIKSFMSDNIYMVFNKDFVYNENLEIGEKPEFLR